MKDLRDRHMVCRKVSIGLSELELVSDDSKGSKYVAGGFNVYRRVSGSVSAGNDVNKEEMIYLLEGELQVVVAEKEWTIKAPSTIHVPAKTYHRFTAKTDVLFLVFHL